MNSVVDTTLAPEELMDIKLPSTPRVFCFVCTGNTCRSPMAEAVLNHFGAEFGIKGVSAGLYASDGMPMSAPAEEALLHAGIISEQERGRHRSAQINEKLVASSERIIGMTSSHAMMLMQLFPFAASKITVFEPEIPDPFGSDVEEYERCLEKIISGVKSNILPLGE